jgi:hypothetical protein
MLPPGLNLQWLPIDLKMRFSVLLKSTMSLILQFPKPTLSFNTLTISGYLGISITEQSCFVFLEYTALIQLHPLTLWPLFKMELRYSCSTICFLAMLFSYRFSSSLYVPDHNTCATILSFNMTVSLPRQ